MTGRPITERDVERILVLIPWLASHPGAAKSEVAARFAITGEQLEKDLRTVLMIGVPPYSPNEYIDVDDEGETVTIRLGDYFRRPLRLTSPEGLALLAAGRALLAVQGSDRAGPLATALDKLERALGHPEVAVEVPRPRVLQDAQEAVAAHARIEMVYWAAGRDDTTTRQVDPAAVFYAAGHWYLDAWCHRAQDDRLFRVDRIRSLRATGEHFEPPPRGVDAPGVYKPRPDDPRVTLDLPASAQWIVEQCPVDTVGERDGRLRVTLTASEISWLERLLLRAGPDARVVDPAELVGTAAVAARRVLNRYRGASRAGGPSRA